MDQLQQTVEAIERLDEDEITRRLLALEDERRRLMALARVVRAARRRSPARDRLQPERGST